MKKFIWVVGSLLAIALIGLSIQGAGGAPPGDSAEPPAAKGTSDGDLSIGTLDSMRRGGVTAEAVDPSQADPVVDRKSAIATAAGTVGFVNTGDGHVTEMSLRLLTDSQYGAELEPDPKLPSRVRPKIDKALVWIVVFEDFIPFMSQPLGSEASPQDREANGRMWIAIDALSGEMIRAQTINLDE